MSVNVCMKLNICIGKLSLAVREVIKSVFVVVINEVFLSSSAELLLLQATTTNWSGGRLLSSQLSIYFNNSRRFFFLVRRLQPADWLGLLPGERRTQLLLPAFNLLLLSLFYNKTSVCLCA